VRAGRIAGIVTEMKKRIRLVRDKRVSLYKNIIGQEKWISIFNLACLHCYANAKESLPNELDTDDLKGLVDDLARMPWKNEISSVGLTGGEFFTRKDAIEIIRYVSEKGFRVLISSNSLLLTDEDISFLAGLPNLKMSISLDGPVAEIHEEIRGPGTYERTVKNIRKLTTAGVFVGVNMFVHDRNLESIEDTLLLADSLGVKAFICINLLYVGCANTELSHCIEIICAFRTHLHVRFVQKIPYNIPIFFEIL